MKFSPKLEGFLKILLSPHIFLGFLFLRPIVDLSRTFPVSGTNLSLTELFGGLFLVYATAVLLFYGKKFAEIPGVQFLLSLLLLSLLSVVYSVSILQTLGEWTKLLSAILAFLVGSVLIKQKALTFRQLFITLLLSAVVPVLFAIYQFATHTGLTTFNVTNRIFGTFAHPNVFAFYLLFLFLSACYGYSRIAKPTRSLEISFIAFTTVIIALLAGTYTRAAWIGLALFLFILAYFYSKTIFFTGMIALIFAFAFFRPLIEISDTYLHTNLKQNSLVQRIVHRDPNSDSLSWRQQVLRGSLSVIAKRPIFGYGYGTFPTVWEKVRPPERAGDDSAEAHNDYLRLAVETGIFGLVLYVSFLLAMMAYAVKKAHKQKYKLSLPIFCSSIAVFIIVSLSDNMLHHTPVMWLVWSYWGAALADL